MSLPASNRKAPSRAAIAATLSAFAVFSASAVVASDVAPQGYGQPAFGYGFQGQLPAGYGYGQQAGHAAVPGYGAQPASTFNAPQGYGAVAAPTATAPVGYGQPQPFPGYGIPGGYPVPGAAAGFPVPGFDPYGGIPGYGLSSQWSNFAPSEPNYAPAERAGATAPAEIATAPAPAPVPAPQTVPVETAKVATTTPDYSYEVAPASSATYVDTTAQYSTGADPYQAITQQAAAPAQQPQTSYQVVEPNYTQAYEAAAAAPAPAVQETVPVNVGGYEYQPAQQQQLAADYYDLSAQTAAAAVAAIAPAAPQLAPAPAAYETTNFETTNFETTSFAPSGTHFVQVGAFLDPARANNLINKLGSAGVQAFSVPAQVRGKLYHRVRIGAASKRDAQLVLDQVRGLNYYEARIVRG